MTHADAFLREIIAHPDDDAPRLIFADWLEEQGDAESAARAEFIRVQCALAADQLSPQQRAALDRRQQQILDEWGKDWARPIRRRVTTWEFHRGFIDRVSIPLDKFFRHAGRIFHCAPIQHLSLRMFASILLRCPVINLTVNMAALAENEHLGRLHSLDLSVNSLKSQDVRALVVSEYLTNLTALDLAHNRIGDGGIRALARSSLLGRLECLNLCGNDIGAGGLRALVQALQELDGSPEGLRLKRLELSGNNLSAAAQRVIAESPLLRSLVFV